MVAFNWSHEPGTSTSPLASTMPHSHPAVPTHSDYPSSDAGLVWVGGGCGQCGQGGSGDISQWSQLTPPGGNEGGPPHPHYSPIPGPGQGWSLCPAVKHPFCIPQNPVPMSSEEDLPSLVTR